MSPPARRISAARRMSRNWGFWGWSSKYWLTGNSGRSRRVRQSFTSPLTGRYHTRPLPPAWRHQTEPRMETLIELAPLIAFFIAYKWFGGIYVATVVLMVAMALLLAYTWLRTRKISQMHLISALLVW